MFPEFEPFMAITIILMLLVTSELTEVPITIKVITAPDR
jgi:hypothetical protein